jgi:hypothetical protein
MFLQGSGILWQACWGTVGFGIHLALDVGVHRRKAYGETPTVEGELWRRAFWCALSVQSRHMTFTGF